MTVRDAIPVGLHLLGRIGAFADIQAPGHGDVGLFKCARAGQQHHPDGGVIGGQGEWLGRELAASKSAGRPWQVLGNQIVMARVSGPNISAMASPEQIVGLMANLAPSVRRQVELSAALFKLGLPFNLDSWDGYPAGRERLYQTFKAAGVQPIVLAGDSHAFWVNDLKDAEGERRAVEFGTSAVSSPSPGDALGSYPLGDALALTNDEVVFCDQSSKGYVLLTLTQSEAQADMVAVSTIMAKPYQAGVVKSYRLVRDRTGLSAPLEA